ncbi:hypothetical protein Pst134EA_028983 [Puccinia striiformis f. sp. tritici]|uniref:hypothetical protein n=1 Tax=Puccinia striiformis f. sp. tritici TaxID=168172 RepID=UPI00200899CB|nr:hypothetical protein Pst134EA_028983 [Puccinia striiformis f. sp. tritici]KAH9446999.1 hypothetical protein Pst134EA_028983 [Puccinia striiformis f. sp. tritici]
MAFSVTECKSRLPTVLVGDIILERVAYTSTESRFGDRYRHHSIMARGLLSSPTILNHETCFQKGRCPVMSYDGKRNQPRKLYYEIHGDPKASQKLVLIMGLMFPCAAWSEQVQHFSSKDDHAVLAFDNRGVGNSECGSKKPYRTSGMAKDVKDLLDFLGWDQDRSLHIFGFSLGGMLSQYLCVLIPKRIKSISFINTGCGGVFDIPPPRKIATLLKIILRQGSYEKRLDRLFELLYPSSYLDQMTSDRKTRREELYSYFQTWFDTSKSLPLAGIFGQLCAAVLHHCSDRKLKKIATDLYPAKIVVISGDQDKFICPSRSLELSGKLPGSELLMFQDAGHFLGSQCTQNFNLLMERIIDQGNQAFSR